ncbi:MAG: group 1 glycosyl transferase [Bryobacterales bacterium]|nr:group 1 glycosyl transferase [Bryobacterales bacterium]
MRKILIVVPHLYGSMRLLADNMRYLDLEQYRITMLVLEPVLTLQDEFPPQVKIVTAAYTKAGKAGARLGYPIDRSKLRRWAHRFFQVWREAKRHDLVISWSELTPTYVTVAAGALARRPVIGWVHIHLSRTFELRIRPRWAHSPAIRLFYPILRRVVGCSRPVSDDLQTSFGLKNVTCISNTVDIQRIRKCALEEIEGDLRELYSPSTPVIINVAALEPQKGQEVLIQAHALVIGKGLAHRLLLVGDGTRRKELAALAKALDVSATVHFAGFRKNPYTLIARSSALVLSSHMEGFALVLAEALALGVPIVSTDCEAGPREVLQDGRFGLLVPVNDKEKLAAAMERILTEIELRERLTHEAQGDCSHIDAARSAAQMESLFEEALVGRA